MLLKSGCLRGWLEATFIAREMFNPMAKCSWIKTPVWKMAANKMIPWIRTFTALTPFLSSDKSKLQSVNRTWSCPLLFPTRGMKYICETSGTHHRLAILVWLLGYYSLLDRCPTCMWMVNKVGLTLLLEFSIQMCHKLSLFFSYNLLVHGGLLA